ncbi:MAG TPA: hypothetical protein VNK49_10645 [Anaerolineales bacterium]|nr:hypothetical protein [Anaerolineales bacterium]
MKHTLASVTSSAFFGFLLMLPFMTLEVISTKNFNAIFNLPLFGILWFLPTLFLIILKPILQAVHIGNRFITKRGILFLHIAFLILIAWIWISILVDQMPCFLGVPNCD